MQKNIRTISSQVQAAENKFAASLVVGKPEAINEEGLPLTEIVEELNEDGDVICEKVLLLRV